MPEDDDNFTSSSDQYIYDAYSGLEITSSDPDCDECVLPDPMDDISEN